MAEWSLPLQAGIPESLANFSVARAGVNLVVSRQRTLALAGNLCLLPAALPDPECNSESCLKLAPK